MKSKFRNFLFLFALVLGVSTACTKTADPEPQPIDQIIGQWNITQNCTINGRTSSGTGVLSITKGTFAGQVKITAGSDSFDATMSGSNFTGSYTANSNSGLILISVSGRLVDAKNLEMTETVMFNATNIGSCIYKGTK